MRNIVFGICLLFIIDCWFVQYSQCESNTENSTNLMNDIYHTDSSNTKVLSRKKRFLAFPVGSSFSVAICSTIGVVGNPSNIYLSWAVNWGVAYELPNQTWIINQSNQKKRMPKPVLQRRYRRELYHKIERAIDKMGYPGKSCVLRALCESPQYFDGKKTNMVEELLRILFSMPTSKVLSFEHNDLLQYDLAHRKGRSTIYEYCAYQYPDCNFSLIELGLGSYSKPYNYMR